MGGGPRAAVRARWCGAVDLGLTGPSGRVLGWSLADWLRSLNDWLTIGLLLIIPIGLAAWQMARAGKPLGVDVRPAGPILIDAAYTEVHWAFYRAAPLILLGDVYGATLLGGLLVGVEFVVAMARNGLGREPEEIQSWLGQGLLLVMTATFFILTRNTWLTITLHMAVELGLKALTGRMAASVRV